MKRGTFFCFLLVYSFSVNSFELPQKWFNLLHYEKTILSNIKSEAVSESFFFAKDGKVNPFSEWNATLKALKQPLTGPADEHPACRFPARFLFFKSIFPEMKDLKAIECPALNKFISQLNADKVALVFSSYYLNNPASSFGHTFLRFIKKGDRSKSELLDFAANYGANVTTNNPIIYGLKGLAGGFVGEFSSMPFFYKVREYNDYESRDLWSYVLNLNENQVNFLILHLWELKQTFFTYFYATKNCSYQILGLLDAVNPSWNLTAKVPSPVLPIDTLYEVYKIPGLVADIEFRPSKRRVLLERNARMSKVEKKNFGQWQKETDPKTKAKLLDLEIDYFDFNNARALIKEKPEVMKKKHELLKARSEIEISSEEMIVDMPDIEAPHLGHKSRRMTLSGGFEKSRRGFQQIEYRHALHDRYDPPEGQPQLTNLEILDLKIRHYSHVSMRDKFVIENVDLVDVESLVPVTKIMSPVNWKFKTGAQTLHDNECRLCLSPYVFFGAGYSWGNPQLYAKFFLNSEFNVQPRIGENGYIFDIGPEAEFFYRPFEQWIFSYSFSYFHRVFSLTENFWFHTINIRHHIAKDISLGLNSKVREDNYELQAQLYLYF